MEWNDKFEPMYFNTVYFGENTYYNNTLSITDNGFEYDGKNRGVFISWSLYYRIYNWSNGYYYLYYNSYTVLQFLNGSSSVGYWRSQYDVTYLQYRQTSQFSYYTYDGYGACQYFSAYVSWYVFKNYSLYDYSALYYKDGCCVDQFYEIYTTYNPVFTNTNIKRWVRYSRIFPKTNNRGSLVIQSLHQNYVQGINYTKYYQYTAPKYYYNTALVTPAYYAYTAPVYAYTAPIYKYYTYIVTPAYYRYDPSIQYTSLYYYYTNV